jgi:molybdate transport system substrate-binding protein
MWDQVKSKVGTRKHITLLADDLAVAAEGTAGILFSTNLNQNLQTVLHVPPEWHDPIRYFGAVPIGKEDDALMADFVLFLKSPEAVEIFSTAGFQILP